MLEITNSIILYTMTTIINYALNREKTTTTIVDGLTVSQYDIFRKIEFYSNSEYYRTRKGKNAPRVPFFNVVNYRVAVAQRATDLDTKDIQVTADEPKFFNVSRLYQKDLYQWMKDVNFGQFLNEFGNTRPKYGHVIIKRVKDSEYGIRLEVCDWRNIITDGADISKRVVERHFMDIEDLESKSGIWDNLDIAIDEAMGSEDGCAIVYEAHGLFDVGTKQKPNYKRVFSYVLSDGTVLFQQDEKLKDFPYKDLAWEKVNGRIGRGVVEDGFQSQQWTNDVVIKEHEMIELSAKRVFLTNSGRLAGNMMNIENGLMVQVNDDDFVRPIEFTNPSFQQAQSIKEQWDDQYNKVANSFGAITGETMPSNTPFRTTAILNSEANNHFDYKKEDAALFLQEVFYDWVLPAIGSKMNKAHIINAEFSSDELMQLDEAFATEQANKQLINAVLNGKIKTATDYENSINTFKELVMVSGERRFIDVPEGYYKDFKPKISVIITNEARNKAVVLESISSILTQVANAPQLLEDPTLYQLFAKAVELSGAGISPTQLRKAQSGKEAEQIKQMQFAQELSPVQQIAQA